jgi:hypothetical protein
MHNFPLEPNIDTLSFFIVYMSHHIRPKSVKSYLSGLVQQLEPDFPSVREVRLNRLVVKVMKGCMKSKGVPIRRKLPLSIDDLVFLTNKFSSSQSQHHDDLLFAALISTGFHALLRLGEMTFPDSRTVRDWRKVSKRSSVKIWSHQYEFFLPAHKADRIFEGNRVLICSFPSSSFDPCPIFHRYLTSRDRLFPAASPLWLTSRGNVPTRSFFISRLRRFLPKTFAGASMRAGGATFLATIGSPPEIIRGLGRWSSNAWELYIRLHPTLLHLLLSHRS